MEWTEFYEVVSFGEVALIAVLSLATQGKTDIYSSST